MKKIDIFNPTTQQTETATVVVDKNGEMVAEFEDGHFLKFPIKDPHTDSEYTKEEIQSMIAEVQAANEGQEIITPEMEAAAIAEREAAESLLDSL